MTISTVDNEPEIVGYRCRQSEAENWHMSSTPAYWEHQPVILLEDYQARTKQLQDTLESERALNNELVLLLAAFTPEQAALKLEIERLNRVLQTITADRDAEKSMKATARMQRDKMTAEVTRLRDLYQRDVFGLNNEGDPIGGDPAGGYANDILRLQAQIVRLKTPTLWNDMSIAPKDGSLVILLVEFDEHSTEDQDAAPTIGMNNFDNDEEDEWRFAGWCWTHDHWTQGSGKPIGWIPLQLPNDQEVGGLEIIQ